jgi:hypothetical protein
MLQIAHLDDALIQHACVICFLTWALINFMLKNNALNLNGFLQ